MKLKIAISLLLLVGLIVGQYVFTVAVDPAAKTSLAMEQFKNPNTQTSTAIRFYYSSDFWPKLYGGWALLTVLMFASSIMQGFRSLFNAITPMKKLLLLAALLSTCTSCSYFTRPFNEPLYVDKEGSDVAVLIETINAHGQAISAPKGKEGDTGSTEFFKDKLVSAQKILIPYFWQTTSRWYFYETGATGAWRPAARCIIVRGAPVTREWTSDGPNAIKVESKDSIQYATGIKIVANIADATDAIKFLSNYPPKEKVEYKANGCDPFFLEVTSIQQVIDEEIHAKILEAYAYESAAYTMDELRGRKQDVMKAVHDRVIPFFKEKGLNIQTLTQSGGFDYDSQETRDMINRVFQAQQDREVAIAESEAAEQRKLALKLKGEGAAAEIYEKKKGEAQGIKAVADANAYVLSKLMENPEAYLTLQRLDIEKARNSIWDGKLPVTILGGDAGGLATFLNVDAGIKATK